MSNVKLSVNGKTFEGWKDVTIKFSLKAIAGSFSVALISKWAEQQTPFNIVPGNKCSVSIDDEQVIQGYVDDVDPSYSANDKTIAIGGRDSTGDLVDCSADIPRGTLTNVSLLQICKRLISPFGVGIKVDPSAGDISLPFPSYVTTGGESVFESISKAAKLRGVLLTNDGYGNIIICRAGTSRASSMLVEGSNILTARAHYSYKERFSIYKVKSQGFTAEEVNESGVDLNPSASASDSNVTRYRPLVIMAEGPSDLKVCSLRAKWEAAVRKGKSLQLNISVPGWRELDGSLWRPNTLVTVKSPTLGVDAEFLLTDVSLRKSDSGEISDLTLEPASAYKPDPTYIERKDPYRQLVIKESERKP